MARTKRKPSSSKAPSARRRGTGAARASPQRPVPVLGNDPFVRGAAPRPPAPARPEPEEATLRPLASSTGALTAAPPSPPTAPPASPAATPSRAPAPRHVADDAARLAAVERKVERAIDGVEERLARLAERAGLRNAGEELRGAVQGILPRLQAGLASALDVVRLLEPAEKLDRFGMDARFAERFAPVADLLYNSWWRTTVREAARVPATGPAIVVANHAGVVPWDALVLREALRRDHPAQRGLRPLLDERECSLTLVGPALVRLGAVRASPEAAEALLADGQLVGVFPEGSAGARKPWRERYRLQRFGRGGFVKLALRTGAPVVPCAIVGSEEASPGISRSGWLAERLGVPLIGKGAALRFGPAALVPLPSRWSLRFGAPMSFAGHGPSAAEDDTVVNVLTERVRSTLQAMLEEDLAARGSVFL